MSDRITKFLKLLPPKLQQQVRVKLFELKQHPFDVKHAKKLHGWGDDTYRLRIGKIRIVYKIHTSRNIEVLATDYRGNIY